VQDLGEVAKELRQIQEEWKRFGTAPPGQSQALWEQFRKVKDELRSRCDAYFADNLKKKEALCEKVEILADSTQWNETAEAIKQIQAEWKQIGPVPHKKSEALWIRFRKPCDRFFEARNEHFGRLKQEREENDKKKVALCEKVEALADSNDWEEVTEQIKQIQAEWKQIGPVSRKNSEALWNRFRGACDHFFDRRKRRGELEIEEKLRRAEAICSDLESFVSSFEGADAPRPGAVGQKISESWDEWGRVGWIPPEQAEPFDRRFRRACEQIVAGYPESLSGTDLDPPTTRKKREKLCARLERLVDSHTETAKAPSAGNLAEKLKQAMAASAFGGSSTPEKKKDWRASMQEAERAKASWDRLGPIIEDVDQALADRFQKTYSRLLDLRRAPAPRHDGTETPRSK
jgi:HPt (histidine-containing phosphotransfer) domain-containing protein